MKKKIICLLLIVLSSFGFTKVVEAKKVYLYFLVNCEESRRRYREWTGNELTSSGLKEIEEDKITDEIKGELADNSSSNTCGPNISGKLACSFGCIEEAINNVTNGTVYKAETMEELMKTLDDAGVGNSVGSGNYCREVCADKKKFEAPEDNSVIAKQGTRFNWLNSDGHILTLKSERNCKVIFDSKTWESDYNAAVSEVSNINAKLKRDEDYEWCPNGYSYAGERKCISNVIGKSYTLSCDSNYYYDSDHNGGIVCKMTTEYKNKLKSQRNEAIKKTNDLISNANGCYNRVSPDYKPCDDVEVSYGDEVYGPILDADKDAKRLVRTGSSGLTRNSMDTKTIYITKINSCGDSSCSISSAQINLLKAKTLTYKGNYAWDLQDDLFMCVGIDGYSYLRCEIAENKLSGSNSYFGKYKNFIKLDSSNFPVNFNSAPTVHDIKIDYKCENATNNTCHYAVTECIGPKCPEPTPCDPTKENCGDNGKDNGKIDVIYRVINLNNPFPNREPGSNWNKENYVNDYITKNRNVNTEEIYTKEPMYEITLDPSLIREIRNDNKSVNYGDLNLYCKDGDECRSEYIKKLSDNGKISGCGTDSNFNSCKAGDR